MALTLSAPAVCLTSVILAAPDDFLQLSTNGPVNSLTSFLNTPTLFPWRGGGGGGEVWGERRGREEEGRGEKEGGGGGGRDGRERGRGGS